MGRAMSETKGKSDREERLSAKLRENLRRRKAQTREMGESPSHALPKPRDES